MKSPFYLAIKHNRGPDDQIWFFFSNATRISLSETVGVKQHQPDPEKWLRKSRHQRQKNKSFSTQNTCQARSRRRLSEGMWPSWRASSLSPAWRTTQKLIFQYSGQWGVRFDTASASGDSKLEETVTWGRYFLFGVHLDLVVLICKWNMQSFVIEFASISLIFSGSRPSLVLQKCLRAEKLYHICLPL